VIALEYPEFKKRVGELIGTDLENYKNQQMDRRIHSLKELWEIGTYEELLMVLKSDPEKYRVFVNKLTINVSEFFRNPERYRDLQNLILPELLARNAIVRVWSAGCSDGCEPYTVAIIAKELGVENRVKILGTDFDREILEKAKRAVYGPNELKHMSREFVQKYFSMAGEKYTLVQSIASLVEFRFQNLLLDPFEKDFQLIICRNVVIYFVEAAKNKLYERFFEVLKPGGYFMVGGTEPILQYRNFGFENRAVAFYQKPLNQERVR
jgi:chemotaxis protein methyltransferase CheR